jgi:hypothetical protein
MAAKYYVNNTGDYLGAFEGNTGKVPQGAIEVPTAPPDARCKWNAGSSSWGAAVIPKAEQIKDEVNKQFIVFAQAVLDWAIRNDKSGLIAIDNKINQIKNS